MERFAVTSLVSLWDAPAEVAGDAPAQAAGDAPAPADAPQQQAGTVQNLCVPLYSTIFFVKFVFIYELKIFVSQADHKMAMWGFSFLKGVGEFFQIHSESLYKYPNDSKNHPE